MPISLADYHVASWETFSLCAIHGDHIFWFATANSLEPLADSIVDRLIVFQVALKPDQMLAIQKSLFHEANLRVGGSFTEPEAALFEAVAGHNPRMLSRLWPIAMGFACEAGRRHLVTADLRSAEQVLVGERGREGDDRVHPGGTRPEGTRRKGERVR